LSLDAAQLGKLTESLEHILNKAQVFLKSINFF